MRIKFIRRPFVFALASALSLASVPASAQLPDPIQAALSQWQSSHGSNWRLIYDQTTRLGRMLLGGGAQGGYVPTTDAEAFALSRAIPSWRWCVPAPPPTSSGPWA